jgi:hypothetical protein
VRILPEVDGVLDDIEASMWLRPPFGRPPAPPPRPSNVLPDESPYRRPSQSFESYRRLFGQNDDFV